jgi:PKD repeat protein
MKRLLLVIIGFILLLAPSCKKEMVEDPSAEDPSAPVFYFNGTINSAPVGLRAGIDDYYMYSYFKQDGGNGLYSFFGNIRQVNCTNCINHLTFKIYDSKLSAIGATANIDSTLIPKLYQYAVDTASSARLVAFTALTSPGDTANTYFWDFGDGANSILASPIHTFNIGTYNVCLTINYKYGCQGSICNTLNIVPENTDDCSVTILDTALSLTLSTFYANSKTANSYNWNFDDTASGSNNFSTLQLVDHNFSSPGIYKVSVQVSNSSCTSNAYKYIATANFTAGCFANYTYQMPSSSTIPFSKIVVYWTDGAGITYSSGNVNQPANSYFEVLSVEEYKLNENKERTKKIHARLKCLVSNGASSVTITDADATFAISFP